jgi:hypothetical protein
MIREEQADAMKSLTPKTVKHHIGVLRVMFNVAIRWQHFVAENCLRCGAETSNSWKVA